MDGVAYFFLILLFLFLPIAIIVTIWFWARRHLQPIKARSPVQLVFGNVVFIIFVLTLCLQRIFWETYPCIINLWQGYLGIILIGNIYAVRAWMLYTAYMGTQERLHQAASQVLATIRTRLSTKFLIKRIAIASMPLLIFPTFATFTVPGLLTGTGYCNRGLADYFLSAYFGAYIGLFLWFAFKLQDVFDGFGIKRELKIVGFAGLLALSTWTVFNSVHALKLFNERVFPMSTLALLLAIVIAVCAGTIWPLHRSYILNDKRYMNQAPASRNRSCVINSSPLEQIPSVVTIYKLDTLGDVLYCDFGIEAFRKFCVSEFAAENLLFWEAVEQYRKTVLKENNPEQAVAQASLLYQKYIARDAPLEINLSSEILRGTLKSLVAAGVITLKESQDARCSTQQYTPFSLREVESLKPAPSASGWVSQSVTQLPRKRTQGVASASLSLATGPLTHDNRQLALHSVYDSAQEAIFKLMESDTFTRFCFSLQHREMMKELQRRNQQAEVLKELQVL